MLLLHHNDIIRETSIKLHVPAPSPLKAGRAVHILKDRRLSLMAAYALPCGPSEEDNRLVLIVGLEDVRRTRTSIPFCPHPLGDPGLCPRAVFFSRLLPRKARPPPLRQSSETPTLRLTAPIFPTENYRPGKRLGTCGIL